MKIKKHLLFFLFLLLVFNHNSAQSISFDTTYVAKVQISVLYFEEGEEVYTLWGHLALRIIDSNDQSDLVYNFGTFNFDTENFYIKFLHGNLNYYLSSNNFTDYLNFFRTEQNRGLQEYVLDLNLHQKKIVLDDLVTTYKYHPTYHYDFLYDNCATRIANILYKTKSFPIFIPESPLKSFRDAVLYFPAEMNQNLLKLGIDILLGSYADKKLNDTSFGFLPRLFWYQLSAADYKNNVIKSDKIWVPFKTITNHNINMVLIFICLLLAYMIYLIVSYKKYSLFLLKMCKTISILYGLIGLLVLYMWLFCNHPACDLNYNILWANPLNIVFLLIARKNILWHRKLGIMILICSFIYILIAFDLRQFSVELWLLNILSLVIGLIFWVKKDNPKRITAKFLKTFLLRK